LNVCAFTALTIHILKNAVFWDVAQSAVCSHLITLVPRSRILP
jgi:hypothetical protein